MKIKNKLNKLISGFTAAVMCFTMLPCVKTITSEATAGEKLIAGNDTHGYGGENDGYTFDLWVENLSDSGAMTLGEGATFSAEWSTDVTSGNFLARRGLDCGSVKKATDYEYISLTYDADLHQTESDNGYTLLGVNGWMRGNCHVEYCIIEDWVDWCPDAQGKMVTIDGAKYKIFKVDILDMGIDGSHESIKRYYSVRQNKRSSGSVTVTDHFKAWENEGWYIGNLYDVTLCVDAWQSSGYADVTTLDFDTSEVIPPLPETDPDPKPVTGPDENGHYINEEFESGKGGFFGRGEASVEVTSSVSKSGSNSLAVNGRTESWNGVEIELDPETFKAGETYGFSVMAMQNKSPSENFSLTLQYCNSDGLTYGFDQYAYIATAKGEKGEWVQLANPSFTIPDGATNLVLYVNTYADDVATTTDFFVDDFVIALENRITVNEPSPGYIRGDLNNDGKINIYDLQLERNAIINSSSDDSYSPAADVDGDGMVAVNDLVLLSQYIHGKITKFPSAAPSAETASK